MSKKKAPHIFYVSYDYPGSFRAVLLPRKGDRVEAIGPTKDEALRNLADNAPKDAVYPIKKFLGDL